MLRLLLAQVSRERDDLSVDLLGACGPSFAVVVGHCNGYSTVFGVNVSDQQTSQVSKGRTSAFGLVVADDITAVESFQCLPSLTV